MMNLLKHRIIYKKDLPANFHSWNEFYDELIRLGLIQPGVDVIRIRVFTTSTANPDSINKDQSLVQHLTYERKHIEQMCLAELRQSRAESSRTSLTIKELTELKQLISNQASRLKHWDLLVKLNEQLIAQQEREKDQMSYRTEPDSGNSTE